MALSALSLVNNLGVTGTRFSTLLAGVSTGTIVRVIAGNARIGSDGLIIDRLPQGVTNITAREVALDGSGFRDTDLVVYGATALDQNSTLISALAKGQTDAQQRAAIAAGTTTFAGLQSAGLGIVPIITGAVTVFYAVNNAALSSVVESNAITIVGVGTGVAISVSGGSYSVNGGAYSTTAGTVSNGDTVKVRLTTGSTNSTASSATLTVGGVAKTFNVTTAAAAVVTPTLNTITVSNGSGTVGTAFSSTINGLTSGSSFALTGAGAAGLSVAGAVINGTPTTVGAVNIVETLAGATNSPKTTSGIITVASAAATVAVKSLRTTQDLTTARLASTAVTPFAASSGSTAAKEVLVDTSTTYQTWIGLGGALTDSAASVIMNNMTASQRDAFLTQLFDPVNGIGLNFVRLCMGDSDYTTRNPNGPDNSTPGAGTGAFSIYDNSTTDDGLASFSCAQDLTYIIPVLKLILAKNPNIKIKTTPWTPPLWMKNTAAYAGSNNYYINTAANNSEYAQYFVKFQQFLFAQIGRYADYATVQNEPDATPNYPGCKFNGQDIAALGVAIRSAFDAANIPTLLLSGDVSSWQQAAGATSGTNSLTLYPFKNGQGAAFAGAAYHGYAGNPSAMLEMAPYTGKLVMMTEHCDRNDAGVQASAWNNFMGNDMVGSPAYGASVVAFWNIALGPNGQPGTADNLQAIAGIGTDGTVTLSPQFYALAHIASYVKPGAVRVASTSFGAIGSAGADVQTVSFKNPDGSVTTILFNSGSASATVTIKDQQSGNQQTSVPLISKEVRSVTWKNAVSVVVPDAQAFQVVPATPTSVKVNAVAPVAANGGSPVTGYDIWTSAAQGGTKTKIATNVASGYEITGLTTGVPVYVQMYPRNSAGPATTSAEQTGTPLAATKALNFTGVQNADVYGVPTASTSSASNIRVINMRLNYQSYASGSNGTMTLAAQGKSSGLSKAETEWLLGSFDTTGTPIVLGYNATGTFKSATGTTPWTGAPYKTGIINGSSNAFNTPFPVGGSTASGANSGGAAVSVPAGSVGFFESLDGITWSQLGNLIATWGTGGINNLGTASRAPAIGSLDTTAANKAPTGQFYRLTVTDGTTTLYDIDFTTQTPGTGPYTANVGGNWTIYPTSGSGISVS